MACTIAPSRLAVAIACRPATAAPWMTNLAGRTVPAAVVIIGIGLLLLALAEAKHEYLGIKEPLSVLAALVIAGAILGGAALAARRGGKG